MKENKLVNIVLVMIVVFMILFITKGTVLADDNSNTNFVNLTGTITGGNNTTNNTTNNTANNIINRPANNTVLTTNNTIGNNSALPKTGIGDSMSGIVLVVILGISAVYAYNKIQDYKNI